MVKEVLSRILNYCFSVVRVNGHLVAIVLADHIFLHHNFVEVTVVTADHHYLVSMGRQESMSVEHWPLALAAEEAVEVAQLHSKHQK